MAAKKSTDEQAQIINDEQIERLIETVSNVSDNAVENSKKAVDQSVKVVKDYPVHAAIGAGVLGFIAGMITKKILK